MTLQTLPGLIEYPITFGASNNILWFSSSTYSLLDAAGEKYATLFYAPKTGNINKIAWRTKEVTSGDNVDVRLESIDSATGNASGNLQDINSNATQTGITADTWFVTTLDDLGAVTLGDPLAVVIEAPVGFSGNLRLSSINNSILGPNVKFPYVSHYSGASWSRRSYGPVLRIGYDDGTWPHIPRLFGGETFGEAAVNTGSTPNEVGAYFKLPFKATLSGVNLSPEIDADTTFKLYAGATVPGGSTLATFSLDSNIRSATVPEQVWRGFPDVALAANTWYRWTIQSTGVTSTRLLFVTVPSTPVWNQMGSDENYIWTEENGAGGWTNTDTKRALGSLLLSALDDGAGGGGGGGGSCLIIGG